MAQVQLDDYGEAMHFSPDGRMLICAHTKRDISLWRVTGDLEHFYSFSSGLKRLYSTALSQDGTRLATVGEGPLRVWQLFSQTREAVLELERKFADGYLSAAVFSPDGTRVLAAGTAETLYVVGLQTNTLDQDTGLGIDEDADDGFWLRERTSSLVFHPDGKTLLATSSSQGGSAALFCELRFDRESYFLSERTDLTIRLPADVLLPATFSRDGRFFAFSDWDLHLYQFPSQQRLASFQTNGKQCLGPLPDRGSANVEAVWSNALFTPDGQTLICGSPSGTIFLWDVPSGGLRQALTGHNGGVLALALDLTGTRLASSGQDKTLRLWQIPG